MNVPQSESYLVYTLLFIFNYLQNKNNFKSILVKAHCMSLDTGRPLNIVLFFCDMMLLRVRIHTRQAWPGWESNLKPLEF